jgi:hypothetical protein
MMLQFSQPPKSPSPESDFEAWRSYAARVSQALRERREDAYEESARNDSGSSKPIGRGTSTPA